MLRYSPCGSKIGICDPAKKKKRQDFLHHLIFIKNFFYVMYNHLIKSYAKTSKKDLIKNKFLSFKLLTLYKTCVPIYARMFYKA